MTESTSSVPFLDLAGQHDLLRDQLDVAVKAVLSSERFVGGPEVTAFENEFAAYCGVTDCVGVGNGTDAMELVLAGLGIGRGDEVIVPTKAFVATVEACVRCWCAASGFVDVLTDTLLIDPAGVGRWLPRHCPGGGAGSRWIVSSSGAVTRWCCSGPSYPPLPAHLSDGPDARPGCGDRCARSSTSCSIAAVAFNCDRTQGASD